MSRITHLSLRIEEVNNFFIVRLKVAPFLLILTLYNWILEKFNLIWKALQTPSSPPPTHNIQRGSGRGRPLRTNQATSRATTSRFRRRRQHCAPVHLHPTCLREIQSLRSQSRPQATSPPPPPYSESMRQDCQPDHGHSGTASPEQEPQNPSRQSPGPATSRLFLPPDFWNNLTRPPPTGREFD